MHRPFFTAPGSTGSAQATPYGGHGEKSHFLKGRTRLKAEAIVVKDFHLIMFAGWPSMLTSEAALQLLSRSESCPTRLLVPNI